MVVLTHRLTSARELKMLDEKCFREKQDDEEKRLTELAFISVELIFWLEAFAEICAQVAVDSGITPYDHNVGLISYVPDLVLDLNHIEGEWKSK